MIRIIYFSVSGNTRAFVKKLQEYAEKKHLEAPSNLLIELNEITDQSHFQAETSAYVAFVPTYLDGGDGRNSGTNEIMTNTLSDYLAHGTNKKACLGIVGSGNKNFNWQYCLTAKQYAERFACPFLADYELRGTPADVSRIYDLLNRLFKEKLNEATD